MKKLILLAAILFFNSPIFAQFPVIRGAAVQVKFDQPIRPGTVLGLTTLKQHKHPIIKHFNRNTGVSACLMKKKKPKSSI
jgi:3-hydroxymyristoyl/3-hydroxydecanoyl-(acyl carrier protein) dehydratase